MNSAKAEAERKYTELLEQLARQNAASQGQNYQQVQQAGQQASQQAQELLSAEEVAYFQENALINPGETYRQFADVIYERGVKRETERVKQELRQEFGQVASQFAQQLAPMAINSYEQTNFNTPLYQQVLPQFRELVQQEVAVNPGVVNNVQALNTLRSLAVARALEGGQLQMNTSQPSLPFSEVPGSPLGNFRPQGPQADPRAVEFGRLLGIDPKVTAKVNEVFERNGVYRNE